MSGTEPLIYIALGILIARWFSRAVRWTERHWLAEPPLHPGPPPSNVRVLRVPIPSQGEKDHP